MRSRIAILAIILLTAILIGCPMMPQPGTGKELLGDGAENAASAAGSIQVVNDESRGQAVYINESGQRFDVTAEEYAGGPQIRCVQVVDFTKVEPSTDADALPVKAIVAGTRDDGTPGVWEIHSDDSILLPQPEQTDDNTARCIIGGDITTLPDGMQVRLGWMFKVTAVSPDGRLIVGVTRHPRGFMFNTTEVMATSSVAVYWRVYKLAYSRFLVVSSPRVIGVVTNPIRPAGWEPHGFTLSSVLSQLRQFFLGRFESYLTTADSVQYDAASGVYKVKGLDELGLAAFAAIDKTTVASIIEPPDLTVGNVMFSPETADVTGALSLSAEVKNLTFDGARPGTLEFRLNEVLVAQAPTPAITANGSTGPITVSASLANLGLSQGVYNVTAKVIANPQDGEIVTDNNTAVALNASGAPAVLTLTSKSAEAPDLTIASAEPAAATVALPDGVWPFTVVVKNLGDGNSSVTMLRYNLVNADGGKVDLPVEVPALGPKGSNNDTFTDTLNNYTDKHLGKLGITSGTNAITISVDAVANERITDNNKWASPVTLTVTQQQPDLAIASVEPAAAKALGTGDVWPFTVVVKNEGDAVSAESVLHYQLSNANGGTPVNLSVKVPALGPKSSLKADGTPNDTFTDTLNDYGDKHLGVLGITSGINSVTVSVAVVANEKSTANNRWDPPVTLPVIYPELVIDTYYPVASGGPFGFNALYLFDSTGALITSETSGNGLDADFQPGYAGIDFTAGLVPGDYYVRIQAVNPVKQGAYAIRVLQKAPVFLPDAPGRDVSWFYDQTNPTDAPYEGLDGTSETIPAGEAIMSFTAGDVAADNVNKLNRYLDPGDYDWIKITLP